MLGLRRLVIQWFLLVLLVSVSPDVIFADDLTVAASAERPREMLGVIVPLTGGIASMGVSIQRSLRMLSLEGIDLQFEDDRCDPKQALSAYLLLRQRGARYFYLACSGSVLAVAPLAKKDGVVVITAHAASAAIRNTGPEVIRYVPDAYSVSQEMIGFLKNRPEARIGMLHEHQEYAVSVADLVEEGLKDPLVRKVGYLAGEGNYRAEILQLRGSKVDTVVLIPTAKESVELIYRQFRELNWYPTIVGDVNLCDYHPLPSEFGLSGFCWRAELHSKGFYAFVKRFKELYKEPPQFPYYDALSFDSVVLLDRAVVSQGADVKVSQVVATLLQGGEGKISSYSFEPSGEIVGGGEYLKEIRF